MHSVFAGKTILVVEDEQGLREPLAENFESLGCRVLQAKNGHDAFALIRSTTIDAVISDIRMPGGDGLELLKELQEVHTPWPATMLMTGYAEFRQEDAYQLGAQDILDKPFDLDRLEGAVTRLLTPSGERWHGAPHPKDQAYAIEQTYPSLEEAVKQGSIGIGRGGFFLRLAEKLPAIGKPVNFALNFRTGPLALIAGRGLVRWSRLEGAEPSDACYGIEFDELADSVRDDILQLCRDHHLRAYIPNKADLGD